MTTTTTTRPRKTTTTPPAATPAAVKRTRTPKDPAQRAQEALDVAQRLVEKVQAAIKKHDEERAALMAENHAASRRRDYLMKNPDLPANQAKQPVPVPDTTEETTTP